MTYSLVARDDRTGELGVAVQSHWFSVGGVVTWAAPGVGAVATQSVPGPGHGPRLLEDLRAGTAPGDALRAVLDGDEAAAYRQTALVDARGRVAVHTGAGCMADAGHVTGDGWSCQANMMDNGTVWGAMAEAFTAADTRREPLAERLLAALDAAEAAGGDVRGRQSAALVVVGPSGESWERRVDLRVEDHPEPLAELRRLLVLHRAYALAGEADELMGEGDHVAAGERYAAASALVPDNPELLFWAGLASAQTGAGAGGVEQVRRSIALNPRLARLLERLGPDVAPAAEQVRAAL
jgi:uncharacterized Ntn-hydrolase superfamily protein